MGEQDLLLEELRQIKAGILKLNSAFPKQSITHGAAHVVNVFRPSKDAMRTLAGITNAGSIFTPQPLVPGLYHFSCDGTMWVEVSPTPVAQVNASYRIYSGATFGPILIRMGDYVAAIADSAGTFTLFMKPVL